MSELAPYYFTIYWIVVLLLTLYKFVELYNCPHYMVIYKRDDYKPFLFFSFFYILLYGLRPVSGYYFGDTSNYAASYEMLQTYGTFNAAGLIDVGADWLFNIVMLLSAQVIDVNVFFVIVISFYIMLMYAGCRKLDLWHGATLMLFCIGAFSFYTYSVNGIRNGVVCSIVILALAGVCKGERVWPVLDSLSLWRPVF